MVWKTVIVAVVMLPGCAYYGPNDLKLVALGEVNLAAEPQVLGFRDASGLYIRPDVRALKVVFSSRADLLDYAKDDVVLTAHADFCNAADRPPDFPGQPWSGLSWPHLYSDNKDLDEPRGASLAHEIVSLPNLPRGADGNIIYNMYIIFNNQEDRYAGLPQRQRYNLSLAPSDVCLNVFTSGMVYWRNSNTIKIPAELLKSALGRWG
jgi:hypothetical protein